MSKFVGTGPSSYKKGIYRAAVSQRLRNTALCNVKWEQTSGHRVSVEDESTVCCTFVYVARYCGVVMGSPRDSIVGARL